MHEREGIGEALQRSTATQPPDYLEFYLAVAAAISSGTAPRGLVKYLAAELAGRRRIVAELVSRTPEDFGPAEQKRAAQAHSEMKLLIGCADRLPSSWRSLLLSEGGFE